MISLKNSNLHFIHSGPDVSGMLIMPSADFFFIRPVKLVNPGHCATSFVSCHPSVCQHAFSPMNAQPCLSPGNASPHFGHCRFDCSASCACNSALSLRMSMEIYSSMPYGSRCGRRRAQFSRSISTSCASSISSNFRSPDADCLARCAALRCAADLGIITPSCVKFMALFKQAFVEIGKSLCCFY